MIRAKLSDAIVPFAVTFFWMNVSIADDSKRQHVITVDDYFTLSFLTEAVISPDGKHIAFAEARWQQASNDRKADLWVVDAEGGKPVRLTFDRASERNLKWSPDGKFIYCLANRKREGATAAPLDGKAQVWRIPVAGGEPLAVTRVAGGIEAFDLSADGTSIFFQTSREEVAGEWSHLRNQFDNVQYAHGKENKVRIERLDLQTWHTKAIVELTRGVADFAVSPDASKIALVTAPEDKVVSYEGKSDIQIVSVADGKVSTLPDKLWRKDAPSPYGRLNSPSWSPDGKILAFAIAFDGYPSEFILARWDSSGVQTTKLARAENICWPVSVDGDAKIRWRNNSTELCAVVQEQARNRLYSVSNLFDAKPTYKQLTPGDVVVDSPSFDQSGNRAAVIAATPTAMQDVYLIDSDGKAKQLTKINPQVEEWKIPKSSIVKWKGKDGVPVEGILELPPGAKPGEPLPLIVCIHGGPTSASLFQLNYSYLGHTLFASMGYAVMSPNYRGSTSYGDKFLVDLIGHENDRDVEDILTGIEHLVAEKIADPERIGLTGWSNGGFLTNCLITRSDRMKFKAASSGAGIADWAMEWGINDEPAYAMIFKKNFPWQNADVYRKTSPLFQFDKVKTPTIFHVGGSDERCPPGNSKMLYRALHEYVKVPTELLVYPNEPHGLGRYNSRKAKLSWDVAWFERYLKGNGEKK